MHVLFRSNCSRQVVEQAVAHMPNVLLLVVQLWRKGRVSC